MRIFGRHKVESPVALLESLLYPRKSISAFQPRPHIGHLLHSRSIIFWTADLIFWTADPRVPASKYDHLGHDQGPSLVVASPGPSWSDAAGRGAGNHVIQRDA